MLLIQGAMTSAIDRAATEGLGMFFFGWQAA